MRYRIQLSSVVLALLTSTPGVSIAANDTCQALNRFKQIKKELIPPSQIIVIKSLGGSKAKMTLCQRHKGLWKPTSKPFNAVIGKNGLASVGEKREGDLKTPAGFYPIGGAFGTEPLALKMDFKYITAEDKFIDDVNHEKYNSWVSGATDAKSYESMLTQPYRYGAIINYNMNPTIAGKGSAIFIHLWRSPTTPTMGCIALDKKHLLMVLHWLDKAQHPYILTRY